MCWHLILKRLMYLQYYFFKKKKSFLFSGQTIEKIILFHLQTYRLHITYYVSIAWQRHILLLDFHINACLNKQIYELFNKQYNAKNCNETNRSQFNGTASGFRETIHNVDFPTHVCLCKGVVINSVWPTCVGSDL